DFFRRSLGREHCIPSGRLKFGKTLFHRSRDVRHYRYSVGHRDNESLHLVGVHLGYDTDGLIADVIKIAAHQRGKGGSGAAERYMLRIDTEQRAEIEASQVRGRADAASAVIHLRS